MICPCCKMKSSSWKIHTFSSGSTRSSQPQHQPPVSQEITPPLDEIFMTTHPNLYYQHQTPEFRNNYAILSLAVPSPNGGARLLSTALRTDGKNDEESPQTLECLYYIGRSLSPCLLPPVDIGAKSKDTFASMTSIEQQSPLRRFLHGLAGADLELNDSTTRCNRYIQREHNRAVKLTQQSTRKLHPNSLCGGDVLLRQTKPYLRRSS